MKKDQQKRANEISQRLDELKEHLFRIDNKKDNKMSIQFSYTDKGGYSQTCWMWDEFFVIPINDYMEMYKMKLKSKIESLEKEYELL